MRIYPPGSGAPLEPHERLITYSSDGGRRRKKNGFLKHVWDVILWTAVGLMAFLAIEAMPYLLKFEPGDIMAYSDNNIFGKVEVLKDGLRHKREISEIKFSHDGKTVTLTDEKGTLTDISGEGYGEGDEGEFQRDTDEARRILSEWGLD